MKYDDGRARLNTAGERSLGEKKGNFQPAALFAAETFHCVQYYYYAESMRARTLDGIVTL